MVGQTQAEKKKILRGHMFATTVEIQGTVSAKRETTKVEKSPPLKGRWALVTAAPDD